MQRCVLPAFLNNDIESLSADLPTVEAHAVALWMLQRPAQCTEDEKGNLRKGIKKGEVYRSYCNPFCNGETRCYRK